MAFPAHSMTDDVALAEDATASDLLALLAEEFSPSHMARSLRLASDFPVHVLEPALVDPAARSLARRGKRLRARLVEAGWNLGGAGRPLPRELPLIVEILHAGSLIVDDVEDRSTVRRGAPTLHRQVGMPIAINTGNWMYFWPDELLRRIDLDAGAAEQIRLHIHRTLYRCHVGQGLDLGTRLPDLGQHEVAPVARAIADLKAGCLMELSASIGALAAGADPSGIDALAAFGRRLGIGLQRLDDLAGLSDVARDLEDLREARVTWPWAWLARKLDPVDFDELRLHAARVAMGDDPAPLAAQLLEHCGDRPRRLATAALEDALRTLESEIDAPAGTRALREAVEHLQVAHG